MFVCQAGAGRIHIVAVKIEHSVNSGFIIVLSVIGVCGEQAFVRTFGGAERTRLVVVVDEVVRTAFSRVCSVTAVIVYHVIDMLRFMAPCYTIYVFIEVLSGALRGTGDVLLPTLITLGGVCLIRIPWIMFVLPAHHTTTCVMLSYPISWITTTALIIPYYLYRKKHAYD